MLNQQEAKARARILKTFLAEHGVALPYGVMLEAVARTEHHKNWATYLAATQTQQALSPATADTASWPVRVFFVDVDEELRVLPQTVTLGNASRYDDWGLFDSSDALPVPEGFAFGPHIAIQAVRAELPSVGEYGLPDVANEETAATWLRAEYGVAVTEPIDITVHDRGDDGGARFWFEARIEPAKAQALPQVEPEDAETAARRYAIGRVFENAAGQSPDSLMHWLTKGSSLIGGIGSRRDVSAQPWLRRMLAEAITLRPSYQGLSCRSLAAKVRTFAKDEYERLVLAGNR
jgi:hypothetical protein